MTDSISWEVIGAARDRIATSIHRTPVLTCTALDKLIGARLWLKCENFQKAGSFKSRGACNAVFSLTQQEAARGVVTHSSGNHAAALARAAQVRRIPAHIVMPSDAPAVKVAAVRDYGGTITFCQPTLSGREATAERIRGETGAVAIHPYDDLPVIAGQATAAWELLEDVPDLEVMIAPVGGGGLLSGTALISKNLRPEILVIGAEPKAADDAYRSWQAGRRILPQSPETMADGLRTGLGVHTFPIIQEHVDGILLASERGIARAMRHLLERAKLVVEPSAAVPLAALLEGDGNLSAQLRNRRVGMILSGGNLDLARLPDILRRADA